MNIKNFASGGYKERKCKTKRLIIPKLTILEMSLGKISESEFREYAKNNVIKSATVVKTDEGFILVVQITWKEGEYTLYTFRNRPRAWVSLDRMIAYMEKHELKLQAVTLRMNW
jgi:hypothetical protein